MRESALNSSVRLAEGISEPCSNPICGRPIGGMADGKWRRTPRRFCSDQCKTDTSTLRRAAKLLSTVGTLKAVEILESYQREELGTRARPNARS